MSAEASFPPMREYKPPVSVSPLIKFSRWSALILGVVYGATRHSYLQRKEDNMRETVERERALRKALREEEKKLKLKSELADLAKQVGVEKI
ncbi:unnamed protein product [Bemisia tabaci]|uniref:ATP synthase F(0) complex subunit e, mitochondrial n=1 Tax=Bemisia tabaci TaxID=7038 RepID=A0A9P0A2S6_BEMTA|nr:unnamed protein product [Bemisia tabaci]